MVLVRNAISEMLQLDTEKSIEAEKRSLIASLVCMLLLCIFMAVYCVSSPSNLPAESGITPFAVLYCSGTLDLPNLMGQRRAYLVYLAILAIFTLSSFCWPNLIKDRLNNRTVLKWGKVILLLGTIPFWVASGHYYFDEAAGGLICGLIVLLLLALPLKLTALKTKLVQKTFLVILVCVLAAALIPGLLIPLDLSSYPSTNVISFEAHYRAVVGWGERIASGQNVIELSYYGYLNHLLLAIYQKLFGVLSMNAIATTIKVVQAFVLLAVCGIMVSFARRNYVAVFLCLLTMIPCYHLNYIGVEYPNQSLIRYLSIPLAIMALMAMPATGKNRISSFYAGAITGLSLLLNAEIGIPVGAAFAIYIYSFYRRWSVENLKSISIRVVIFSLGIILPAVAYVLGIKLFQNHWFDLSLFVNRWQELGAMVNCGMLGLPLAFDPVALLILVHTSYVFIATLIKPGDKLIEKDRLRLALATIILFWFTYYVNRPHPWNLQALSLFYSILLVDVVRAVLVSPKSRYPFIESRLLLCAMLSLIWIPYGVYNGQRAFSKYKDSIKALVQPNRAKDNTVTISGVILPRALGNQIERQTGGLNRLKIEKNKTLIYISHNSYLLSKTTGICAQVDPINDLLTTASLENFRTSIEASGPELILLDSKNCKERGLPAWDLGLEAVRKILKRSNKYELSAENEDLWEVWRRNDIR